MIPAFLNFPNRTVDLGAIGSRRSSRQRGSFAELATPQQRDDRR
jgi:hypothetical protein